MKINLFGLLILFSMTAAATNSVRVDAKKTLSVQTGIYKVISSESGFRQEHLCNQGSVVKVAWFGSDADPVLIVGSKSYSDFNTGLNPDSNPAYAHNCKYNHSTQVAKDHLVDETFANCDDENRTTREELIVKGTHLEFVAHTDIARKGISSGETKVISIPSTCTLELQKN
jgi:hypothetical protein